MRELMLAVFDAASAADAAVQDLEVARIPSVVIQREAPGSARPRVTVAGDEMHVGAVTGILNQYGPLELEERAAQSHRRGIAQTGGQTWRGTPAGTRDNDRSRSKEKGLRPCPRLVPDALCLVRQWSPPPRDQGCVEKLSAGFYRDRS